jgi:hypothetical protein
MTQKGSSGRTIGPIFTSLQKSKNVASLFINIRPLAMSQNELSRVQELKQGYLSYCKVVFLFFALQSAENFVENPQNSTDVLQTKVYGVNEQPSLFK